LEQVVVEVAPCVGRTNQEVNVHTREHLPYIGDLRLKKSRGSKAVGAVRIRRLVFSDVIEHELVADGDAKDIVRAVGLQRVLY
jgi:hypothetical protein